MDYKYIEQLLERYWQCDTSLEEEEILRAFFSQADVPAELRQYRSLFAYTHDERQAKAPLGSDFDERMMTLIGEQTPVKARRITLAERMKPLLKAAASVAIIVTISTLMQYPFSDDGAVFTGRYTATDGVEAAAEVARDEVQTAFGLTAEDALMPHKADSGVVSMAIIAADSLAQR